MATENDPPASVPDSPTAAPTKPRQRRKTARRQATQKLPPYHVVLLNDDDHTFDYVIDLMRSVFGYPPERGLQIAIEVDARKRSIVYTTHKELAELKRELIQGFGADVRIDSCVGSMSAVIEAAEG